MWNRLRPTAAIAVVVVLAAVVAGCGNAPAGGTKSSTGVTSARDKAVKFAECMRNNGVNAFPDPDASGQLTIDAVANGSSVDTNSAAFKRAMTVCNDLEPPGFTGSKVTPKLQVARLAFARCIREHGVPDFPDPTLNSPLVDTYRIPSAATPAGMSALNAAMHECRVLGAAALATGGR